MPELTPDTKQQMIKKAHALAYEYEQKHGCCAQCVLVAIQDVLGIVDNETIKASHSLSGGGCLTTTGSCGALTGGMMALSSKFGRDRASFTTGGHYSKSFKLSKQLFDLFVAEFNSPICADVQTCIIGRSFNLWDKNDYQAFEDAGGHRDKCPSVTGRVAAWTVQLLLEVEEKK